MDAFTGRALTHRQRPGAFVPQDRSVRSRVRSRAQRIGCAGVLAGAVFVALPLEAGNFAAAATPTPIPAAFTLTGSGWGHGVGMSQYGALGMAREGKNATQIVTHFFTGTHVAQVRDDMFIRVNLLHRVPAFSFRSESVGLGGGGVQVLLSGGAAVIGTPTDTFNVYRVGNILRLTRRDSVGRVTIVGSSWGIVIRWAGTSTPGPTGSGPTVLNVAKPGASFATGGHRYRYGSMDAAVVAGTAPTLGLELVNRVRLHDDYLRGLGEMSSSWPAAALQAQAIAARSFALARYGSGRMRPTCRCNIDSGHGPYWDQAFVGWSKERAAGGGLWRAAIRATELTSTTGAVILYRTKIVKAFYCAATGGKTQNSEDAWGGVEPWARSVDDHWSLNPKINPGWSAWNPRVRPQVLFAAAFGLPNVVKVQVTSRYISGAVRTITGWSSTGVRRVVSGSQMEARLRLPSSYVGRVTPS